MHNRLQRAAGVVATVVAVMVATNVVSATAGVVDGGTRKADPTMGLLDPPAVNPTTPGAHVTIPYRVSVSELVHIEVKRIRTTIFSVDLGLQDAGAHTYDWDLRDNDGDIPADGKYQVIVRAFADVAGQPADGSDSASLQLDSVAPRPPRLQAFGDALYPVDDGYLDQLTMIVTRPSITARRGHVRISDADGDVVRDIVFHATGDDKVRWKGTDDAGDLVPAGTYAIRASIEDDAGNEGFSGTKHVVVSLQRSTIKRFHRVVTARASLRANESGRCGDLYAPSQHGWKGSIGYYPFGHCVAHAPASVAVGVHAVSVPSAAEYLDARVRVWGGAARIRSAEGTGAQSRKRGDGARPLAHGSRSPRRRTGRSVADRAGPVARMVRDDARHPGVRHQEVRRRPPLQSPQLATTTRLRLGEERLLQSRWPAVLEDLLVGPRGDR